MRIKPVRLIAILLSIASLVCIQPQALFAVGSSGFENASYSARSLAQGNAVVARPDEPSAVVFNPAGLPDLKGVQVDANIEGLDVKTTFKSATPPHGREWDRNPFAWIPTGFITANLGERLANRVGVGLGWTFPFGISNRYETTSVMARYVGSSNMVQIAAITLAAGVKLHERFSIGGGVINYRILKYDQIFNFPNGNIWASAGVPNNYQDGLINTYQHGSGWGWIASILAKPIDHHQIGVFYRSRANVRTHGRAKVNGLVMGDLLGFDTTPYFETGIKSDVQLPSNVTVAYAYVPSKKWAAEVDLGWTGWSVFADQNITFDRNNATAQALGQIPRNYHNTLSLNMGGHYRLTDKFDLLAGAFMYSAASPKENFDAVIPDSNRFAGTLGFTYSITKRLDFSTAYMGILFEERSIENRELTHKLGASIDGKYNTFVHGFMSGFTYKFGKIEDDPKMNVTAEKGAMPVVKEFAK